MLLITILFFAPMGATQSPEAIPTKPDQPRPKFVPGELLVRFRSEAAATDRRSKKRPLLIDGLTIPMNIESLNVGEFVEGLCLVRVDKQHTSKALEALNRSPDVLYAEPNFVRDRFVAPNDPLYSSLWGLRNNGGETADGDPSYVFGADIDAEEAWNITTGSRDVVVGIVDGGIFVGHVDLSPNIWTNPLEIPGNLLDDDGNGYIDDVNGFDFFHNDGTVYDGTGSESEVHGTHVAGTVGAVGNNGVGVVGVNWQVSLMSLKVFGEDDEIPFASSARLLVRAYAYAKQMRDLWTSTNGASGANIRVLNNSLGGYGYSQAEHDAVRALNTAGILFVASAGNYTRNNEAFPIYPAGYPVPNVISVAASGQTDFLTSFTNVGNASVHLAAPGRAIRSTTPGPYEYLSGTSMSAPHVSGAAALICAEYPNINVRGLKAAVIYNGDILPSLVDLTVTGRRLNAFKSLTAAGENDTTAPSAIPDFRIVTQSGRSVTLGWTSPGDDGQSGKASSYEVRYSDTYLSTPEQFEAADSILSSTFPFPATNGSLESVTLDVPYRHTRGYLGLRAVDNMGNASPISVVQVTVPDNSTNFYAVTESAPQPLTTGGTPLQGWGRNYDDSFVLDYYLPFQFPYYGRWIRNLTVSTNGAIYFSVPPKYLLPPMTGTGISLDAYSSLRGLQTNRMIAGMWDDIIITNVYATIPSPDRIIFRWEGTTFDTPFSDGTSRGLNPISVEIELRADGTILVRYGAGNERLFPVVGISDGRPDAYVVNSHTSENALVNLTGANTVIFSPRFPPPVTSADLEVTLNRLTFTTTLDGSYHTTVAGGVLPGQILVYHVFVTDLGPDVADNVVMTAQLPPGTSFIDCESIGTQCTGPPPGSNGGTVTSNLGTVGQLYFTRVKGINIRVRVTASGGTQLATTISASSPTTDLHPANNTLTVTTLVENASPFSQVAAVDGSRTRTVGLKQDGTVWFWGIPYGEPESADYSLLNPVQVEGLSNITAIAAGSAYALALRSDGTVWSWGTNEYGELGRGTRSVYPAAPAPIPGLTNIQTIAACGAVSFALSNSGTVWAWGENSSGQLGDGTQTNRTTPVQLSTIANVLKITTSGSSTYAIKADGSLWVWGSNFSGQLGIGTSGNYSTIPIPVNGLTNVQSVAADYIHTVALKNDGTVWTWGSGSSGQLGNGTQNDSNIPILVPNLTGVTQVDAGAVTCLVLRNDGTVWFWGSGQYSPGPVAGLANVQKVSAWSSQYGVIMPDQSLKMWGFNSYGQLGNGTLTGDNTPAPVLWLALVAAPRMSPDGNTYVFPKDVAITSATEGAVIHYTTNGAIPTESDPIFNLSNPIRVDRALVVKARAWKPGLTPSAVVTASYLIIATGNHTPPQLLLEESAPNLNQAAALDSVTQLRDPFSVPSLLPGIGADPNTRVALFFANLQLFPGEAGVSVTVNLVDANNQEYEVPAEDVRSLTGVSLTQVTFRLPDSLAAGNCLVKVRRNGQLSNVGTIRIRI